MSKIIYIDEETIEKEINEETIFSNNNDESNHSKEETIFSEDEATEIIAIMSLFRVSIFFVNVKNFISNSEKELTSESSLE